MYLDPSCNMPPKMPAATGLVSTLILQHGCTVHTLSPSPCRAITWMLPLAARSFNPALRVCSNKHLCMMDTRGNLNAPDSVAQSSVKSGHTCSEEARQQSSWIQLLPWRCLSCWAWPFHSSMVWQVASTVGQQLQCCLRAAICHGSHCRQQGPASSYACLSCIALCSCR